MKIIKPTKKQALEFLEESNSIEQVYGTWALDAAYEAWKYGLKNIDTLNVDVVLHIHGLLMKLLEPRIAGKIRDCDVYIGGKRKIFVSEALIKGDLKNVISNIMESVGRKKEFTDEEKDAVCQMCHVQFEDVHPFVDGNGRTGRILYNLHRLKLGLPIHVIHADYPDPEGEQMSYYKWFRQ
jgi:Fic family protein